MKIGLLVTTMLAGLVPAVAANAEDDTFATKVHIKELQRNQADWTKRERILRLRLEQAGTSKKEGEDKRVQEGLDETRQVLGVLAKQLRHKRSHLLELQSSPEKRILDSIRTDRRVPRKDDISGLWVSMIPNAIGPVYTLRLELNGKRVRGSGFYTGCLGMSEVFAVSGSFDGELLSLDVVLPSGERRQYRYRLSQLVGPSLSRI